MVKGKFQLRRAFILIYLIGVHFLLAYFLGREAVTRYWPPQGTIGVEDPTVEAPAHTPLAVPSVLVDLETPQPGGETTGALDLIVPVAGVARDDLSDSFQDARGEDRGHDAIDIPAPEGTPVIAAANGVIARFFDSIPGGITIYQLSRDGKYVFYYAHLQKRAEGLKVGDQVTQGQTIGYVGDSGNAGPGNFHLHFSISIVRDPARYWEGEYINPFPLLKNNSR
jgi:peptidoglycan LD-endopeptidase LytH